MSGTKRLTSNTIHLMKANLKTKENLFLVRDKRRFT